MTRLVMKLVLSLLLLSTPAFAAEPNNWPQWRGPNFDGSSAATGLPDKIGPNDNVVWSATMPGPSAATPIVWNDRVFVSSPDNASNKLLAIAIDRKTGREIWRKEVGMGSKPNPRNNTASPSPITDGKHVWFYYGTGDLACFDFDGRQVWARNLVKEHGAFNFMWIYGSSPLLYKGKLYIQVLHNTKPWEGEAPKEPAESYLLAIDPATGKDLWKQARPNAAEQESKESYGTPIPFLSSERGEVVLIGGDVVTGHDPETGKELWRYGEWNPGKEPFWRIIPSVVTGGGLAFAAAPKGGPVMAIKPGGEGNITKTHEAWNTKEFTTDVCVPLYYQDKLYVLDGDRKAIYRVDPATGKKEAEQKLGGDPVFRGSPTGADGKIYCMNEGGEVWVISMPDLKILSEADLGSGGNASRASIAIADGQVFVRTEHKLFCFGKKD